MHFDVLKSFCGDPVVFIFKNIKFTTGSGHILIPFIIGIGAGWGTNTRILLQTFLVGTLSLPCKKLM